LNARRRFAVAPVVAAVFVASVFGFIGRTVVQAQSGKPEKQPFLEDDATPAPKAKKKKSPTPSPSPKKSPKPDADEDSSSKPKKSPKPHKDEDEETSPKPKKKSSPAANHAKKNPSATPTPEKKHEQSAKPVEKNPEPESTPAPRAIPVPTVAPSLPPAQITVEKSGLEEDQGYEPPPPPPPRRGFFARLFGARELPGSYRYLSRAVVEAIRSAPVQRGRWKFVIVHNSGTRQGNARAFDYYHSHVRKMKNGLAYHFVIGNGTSSGNGEVEVGNRWRRQINGGHVHSDYLNNISLGICFVGDFNRDQPSGAQLQACDELIRYLRQRCGRADGRDIPVKPHREMNPPQYATDCPGDVFPYTWFRHF
jgi:hypothetical protein